MFSLEEDISYECTNLNLKIWRGTVVSKLLERNSIEISNGEIIEFREPTADDGKEMYRIVKESKVLDVNSPYSYLLWGKYYSKTSIIAMHNDKVIGFVTGFLPPEKPNTLFVWQVAVDPAFRGHGLATKFIEQLLLQLKDEGVEYLEATVTPTNVPSSNLFK